jgi:hypothetical protein
MKLVLLPMLAALKMGSHAKVTDASAEHAHWTVASHDLTLQGTHLETSLPFEVSLQKGESTQPSLRLDWQAPPEGAESLSLALDGKPFATIRSEEGLTIDGVHRVHVKLPTLRDGGMHVVTLSAQARDAEHSCKRGETSWLRILAGSEVTWPRPRSGMSPRSWLHERTAVPLNARTWVEATGRTASIAAAYVDAVRGLRAHGIQTSASAEHATSSLALVVRKGYALPEGTCAALESDRTRMLLVAPTDADLSCGARALRSSKLWALCTQSPCFIPRNFRADEPADLPAESVVWKVADSTTPEGLTFYGEGESQIVYTWTRPPGWTVRATPTLTLGFAHSSLALLDGPLSTLSVTLNGKPLGTWPLEGKNSNLQHIVANIPREEWSRDSWRLVIRTSLRRLPALACRGVPERDTWIRIDSSSNLDVPRDEHSSDAISDFIRKAERTGADLVLDPSADYPELHAVATMLASLRRNLLVPQSTCSDRPCLIVRRVSPSQGVEMRLSLARKADGGLFWIPGKEALSIAAISAAGTMVAARSGNRLELLSAGPEVPEQLPDLRDLGSPLGVYVEEDWLGIGEATLLRESQEVRADARKGLPNAVVPKERLRLARADMAFLSLIVVLLAIGVWWITRKRSVTLRRRTVALLPPSTKGPK